ncbi:MAG: bifunctional alpha,alpha-trehalose-phosphate synthase (UDP-forming)/trehalose-phosphatase [Spirochaetes bacterium]|nr:bifunctional alpha,alpha-trehalose-phosphate synthase (UDP-forming)/trehalose-phosphatase [Spirochaetota bacterium]
MPKLILIANRLPVTVERKKSGETVFAQSVGGLATGMSSVSKQYPCLWVGFSGIPSGMLDVRETEEINGALVSRYGSYAVPLTERDIVMYYNGFSNKTLWPLFHYFPLFTTFNEETWRSYVEVNQRFYDTFAGVYEPGDIIWVHDYHLMLLPAIIRQHVPEARIGFFLHIPFPSYEVFRLLPWRKEILSGLLGSDLIGCHTYGYVRHILNSVQRIMGIDHSMGRMNTEGRTVQCDTFPMGIDYQRYSQYLDNRRIAREIDGYRGNLRGKKMILSMDRLDFTKGIIDRLNAFERFLEKYPEYLERVQMVVVTVPSRTEVDTYIRLRKGINEQISRINGKYNTLSWSPIQYLYRSLPFEMIMTLYHCADICLVTPLRDGMNLVAKEYVASRVEGDGVLILSEMAGVSEELGEALIVNPNNREEVADSVAAALSMPEEEQRRRMSIMQRRLQRNDVFHWAASFIERLSGIRHKEDEYADKVLSAGAVQGMLDSYRRSVSRLMIIDYDGTLVSFAERPDLAVPDAELMRLLSHLAGNERNSVVIISGRNFEFMERFFSDLPLTLIAEHGAWIRLKGGMWEAATSLDTQWKKGIRSILQFYCDRTPGSFIEEKEFSLAWHYRRSDIELASLRSLELKGNLLHMIANHNLGIMEGNRVLEIKSLEVNKGKVASLLISAGIYDFIFAVGDDITDEDVFAAIPEIGYTVKVGYSPSKARYLVDGIRTVRSLLKQFGAV